MVRKEVYTTLLVISLLLPGLLNSTFAKEVSNRVDADFEIIFLDGTKLEVKMKLRAYKLRIFGESYTADRIRETYAQNGPAFEQVLFEGIESIMNHIFRDCDFSVCRPRVERESLFDSPSNPVVFKATSNVTLTSGFFGTNLPNISDFINGILDMGGRVTYNFNLYAEPGWNVTFYVELNQRMEVVEASAGIVLPSGREVVWEIKNWNGENEGEERELKIKYENPTTIAKQKDVRLDIYLDFSNLDTTILNCSMNVFSYPVNEIATLPSFISGLYFIPADGIRLFVEEGLTDWDKIKEKVFLSEKQKLEEKFNQSFHTAVNFDFKMNLSIDSQKPYNITHMDSFPPVSGTFSDDIYFHICNISSRAFFGFIYAGGKAELDSSAISIKEIGYPFSLYLILPPELGGKVKWNSSSNLTLEYGHAPSYGKEAIEVVVEMSIDGFDLDTLAFLSGGKSLIETFNVRYSEKLYAVKPFFPIPGCISIPYANSDLIRLCLEEGIITKENLDALVAERKKEVDKELSGVFMMPVEGYINFDEGGLEKSKEWDGNIKEMDDSEPFIIPFYARIPVRAGFDLSLLPPSIETKNQTLILKGLPGKEVIYRIIIPKDIEIEFNDTIGAVKSYKLNDGKKLLEVHLNGSSQIVLCYSIKLPPLLVVSLLLPLIMVIALIVAIVCIVAYIRKRRKELPREFQTGSEEER